MIWETLTEHTHTYTHTQPVKYIEYGRNWTMWESVPWWGTHVIGDGELCHLLSSHSCDLVNCCTLLFFFQWLGKNWGIFGETLLCFEYTLSFISSIFVSLLMGCQFLLRYYSWEFSNMDFKGKSDSLFFLTVRLSSFTAKSFPCLWCELFTNIIKPHAGIG